MGSTTTTAIISIIIEYRDNKGLSQEKSLLFVSKKKYNKPEDTLVTGTNLKLKQIICNKGF